MCALLFSQKSARYMPTSKRATPHDTPQKVIVYGISRGRAGLDTAEEEEEKDEEGQEHERLVLKSMKGLS